MGQKPINRTGLCLRQGFPSTRDVETQVTWAYNVRERKKKHPTAVRITEPGLYSEILPFFRPTCSHVFSFISSSRNGTETRPGSEQFFHPPAHVFSANTSQPRSCWYFFSQKGLLGRDGQNVDEEYSFDFPPLREAGPTGNSLIFFTRRLISGDGFFFFPDGE
jgi:hypothetical protein